VYLLCSIINEIKNIYGFHLTHPRILQTLPGLCNIYVPGCRILSNCMYTQDSPAEIQTPKQWNLIDRSMTAPPRVLSPSSRPILPSTSSTSSLVPAIKNAVRFKKMLFQFLYFFETTWISEMSKFKWRYSGKCQYADIFCHFPQTNHSYCRNRIESCSSTSSPTHHSWQFLISFTFSANMWFYLSKSSVAAAI